MGEVIEFRAKDKQQNPRPDPDDWFNQIEECVHDFHQVIDGSRLTNLYQCSKCSVSITRDVLCWYKKGKRDGTKKED